jgi:hypothetical protein
MADIVHGPARYRDERHDENDLTILAAVLKRTSWGAVIAGAVTAISVQMILTVLGIALGVTTHDVVNGTVPTQDGVKTAAGVWWLVSGAASLFIGGCVVGRFAGMTRSPDVLLHGFTMWAVTALFGFMVVSAGAGALYGSSMDATYNASRTMRDGTVQGMPDRPVSVTGESVAERPAQRPVTPDEAQRYVRAASWWTLGGLLLGIGVSLGGSWLTAPKRIIVRPISEPAH